MIIRRFIFAALVVSLLFIATPGTADVVDIRLLTQDSSSDDIGALTPEVQISSPDLAGDQEHPSIAYNLYQDEYMVAWYNARPYTQDITVRRVSNTGGLLSQFFVSTGTNCIHPDLSYNITNRNYLVVWSQLSLITSRWEIWGRIIDWNNAGSNSPFLIASWTGLNLDYPRVAYNVYRNEYMVVWQTSQASSGVLTGIGRRRISNTGTSLTTSEYVTGSGSTNQGSPDIDYNLAGDNYLVAWVEPGPVSKLNIYTGLLDHQGSVPVSKQQLLSNYQSFEQQRPAVASNNSSGFMVVFNVDAPPDIDIYGREVLINGTITNTTYLIAIYAGIDEKNPAIASGSGLTDYFIIFENETLNGTAIKSIHWDPGVSYSEIELASGGMGDNTNPAVMAGNVGMLAAYEWDSFSPTDDKDIYGRVFWQDVVYLPLVTH